MHLHHFVPSQHQSDLNLNGWEHVERRSLGLSVHVTHDRRVRGAAEGEVFGELVRMDVTACRNDERRTK